MLAATPTSTSSTKKIRMAQSGPRIFLRNFNPPPLYPDRMGTGRVIGIGGVFFKSKENKKLGTWYSENLGIAQDSSGVLFKWRSFDQPGIEHLTTWSVF